MALIHADSCKNWQQPSEAHLPDGSCLFNSTRYAPYPPITLLGEPLRRTPWYSLTAPVKVPTPPPPPPPWYRRLWAFLNRPL